jgi:hypothetical protein
MIFGKPKVSARTAKAGSDQVNAGKAITVTGYFRNCQTQEKIGNY